MVSPDGVCPADGTPCGVYQSIKTPATLTWRGWPYGNLWILTLAFIYGCRVEIAQLPGNDAVMFGRSWGYIYAIASIVLFALGVLNRWDGRAQLAALFIGAGVSALRAGAVIEQFGVWDGRGLAAYPVGIAAATLLLLVWETPQRLARK